MLNIPTKAHIPGLTFSCVVDPEQMTKRMVTNILMRLRTGLIRNGTDSYVARLILHDAGILVGDQWSPTGYHWSTGVFVHISLVDDELINHIRSLVPGGERERHTSTFVRFFSPGLAHSTHNAIRKHVNLYHSAKYREKVAPYADKLERSESFILHMAGGTANLTEHEFVAHTAPEPQLARTLVNITPPSHLDELLRSVQVTTPVITPAAVVDEVSTSNQLLRPSPYTAARQYYFDQTNPR